MNVVDRGYTSDEFRVVRGSVSRITSRLFWQLEHNPHSHLLDYFAPILTLPLRKTTSGSFRS